METYKQIIGLGVLTGARGTLGLVALTDYLNRNYDPSDIEGVVGLMASPLAAGAVKVMSIGELIADKTPIVPNRTSAGSLAGRLLTGMLCGAALSSARRESVVTGVVIGGLAACVGTFMTFYLRKAIVSGLGLPQFFAGAAEDALLISGAVRLFENEFIITEQVGYKG